MGLSQKDPIVRKKPPIICIVGRSGSGKTALMERLIMEMSGMGIKVGTIKHHKGPFEMDSPGKDSWRHKQAGAVTALIASPRGIGMVMDVDHDYSPEELALFFRGVDVILCEGYKRAKRPKIEVFRPEVHERPFCLKDKNLKALVSDADLDLGVPRFPLADIKGLTEFLRKHFGLGQAENASCM